MLPFDDYIRTFGSESEQQMYRQLLHAASHVEVLTEQESDEAAYLAAGQRVVQLCDMLLAIWDGQPARGLGGTADIVAYAQSHGTPITHLNPVVRIVTTFRP